MNMKRKKHSWQPFTAGIILVMLLISGFMYYDHDRVQRPTLAMDPNTLRAGYQAYHCQHGNRKVITLADGTRVTLNSQTTLWVPKNYRDSAHTLVLNGEAFFEVPANGFIPFTIITDKLITTGYHGALRIRSAESQPGATVHVLDGQFTVRKAYHSPTDNQPETLIAGNEILFNKDIDLMEKETYNVAELEEWKKGKLVFEDVPLHTAVRKIEAWYGVEIAMRGNGQDTKVSGEFDNVSLDNLLDVLHSTTGVKFSMN